MPLWTWVVVAGVAIVCFVALSATAFRRRSGIRSDRLRRRFGPEYGLAVGTAPSRQEAEKHLAEREERRSELNVHPLRPASREDYASRWRQLQMGFVNDPGTAVRAADRLVQQVIAEAGYPDGDFQRQTADLSVDHPDVVMNYRSAHEVYENKLNGAATTEELRMAMVDYRAMLDSLLGEAISKAS